MKAAFEACKDKKLFHPWAATKVSLLFTFELNLGSKWHARTKEIKDEREREVHIGYNEQKWFFSSRAHQTADVTNCGAVIFVFHCLNCIFVQFFSAIHLLFLIKFICFPKSNLWPFSKVCIDICLTAR